MNVPSNSLALDEIRDELLELDSPSDRLSVLIEFGAELPPFPPELCTEENRVLGCQSMVWLVSSLQDGLMRIAATSDAPMVRGLISILVTAYSGKTPQEILDFPIQDFFESIQLKQFITPMRSNGLHSMIVRVRELAAVATLRNESKEAASERIKMQTAEAASKRDANNLPPTRSIDDCRTDFPILSRTMPSGQLLVYLDNAASSQRPMQVIDGMSRVYREHYSNVHRSGHQLAAETTEAMESGREAIRGFIGAQHLSEVVFTSGTTAAINLVARAWGDAEVRSGDEILLTEMEHHSNIVPWQQLASRTGAVIRWLPIRDDFELDREQLPEFLTERTKLVAITAVSNVLGTINPIRQIADMAHAVGSRILVDAAQAVPHGHCHVAQWDADFVAFSGHKMLGPNGIGILYGKRDLLEHMSPFLGGGSMIKSVVRNGFVAADIPYRFEAGTPPIVEAIAMRLAVEYLQSIGSDRILARERTLTARAHSMLEGIAGLKIFGPAVEKKTGILSFVVDGVHPLELEKYLDAHGIAIRVGHHCAMPLHERLKVSATCRASFYFYNTETEVDRFASVLALAVDNLKR